MDPRPGGGVWKYQLPRSGTAIFTSSPVTEWTQCLHKLQGCLGG